MYIGVCICMYVCIYVHMYVYVCMYVCVCIYIYIYIYNTCNKYEHNQHKQATQHKGVRGSAACYAQSWDLTTIISPTMLYRT